MVILALILAVSEPVFVIQAIKNLNDDDKWIPYATLAAVSNGMLFYCMMGLF